MTESWPKVDRKLTESCESWPKVDRKLTESWPKVDTVKNFVKKLFIFGSQICEASALQTLEKHSFFTIHIDLLKHKLFFSSLMITILVDDNNFFLTFSQFPSCQVIDLKILQALLLLPLFLLRIVYLYLLLF